MDNPQKCINCRICLRHDIADLSKCLSLFETYNGCSISEKVNSIANVKIVEGDQLPHKICPDCLLQLETAIEFKVKCETSNTILLNAILVHQETEANLQYEVSVKDELVEGVGDCIDKEEYLDTEVLEDIKDDDYANTEEDDVLPPVKKSKAINLKLICDDCGGTFKSKCKIRVHWKKVHLPEKLMCHTCKRMFKTYKSFHSHKRRGTKSCEAASKVRIEGQGRSRIFHCRECNYKSKRIKDIDMHLVIHTGDRRYQCKDCMKSFTQHSSLQAHRESRHKDFRIDTTCHLCGKILQGRSNFYRHMKIHKDGGVECKVCNKTLKSKKYLATHMLRHGDVKTYSCEICAASFYTYCEVFNHRKKVHMKTRNVKCDLCDYKVCDNTALKKHKAKHTPTNVVCLVCGQFSENAEALAIHQKRHFDRNIPCTQCDKMYHNKRALSKHMSKNHRCTMLVEKRVENVKLSNPKIKEENSSHAKDEIVILLSPPAVILA